MPQPTTDPHVLVDHREHDPQPQLTSLGWIASCVGGGTSHMGGSLYRLHPDDFRLRSRLGDFESIADWPYSYADLEPYYGQAEWEVGVSGVAGSNALEGPRSKPYPMPPLDVDPIAARFDAACERHTWHAFPTPKAINSRAYGGRPACEYCRFCAGYGCPFGARGSTQEALLARAERTGSCEIRANCMVRRILVNRSGRVTGCIYIDAAGTEHQLEATLVCVCCSAVESARLLLMSTSTLFPEGLANGNGLVGRHLQFHTTSIGRGRIPAGPTPGARDARRPLLLRSVADHYFLPPRVSPFPKGGLHRFELDPMPPVATSQRLALRDGHVIWGNALKSRLRRHFSDHREIVFEVFQDFIPNAGTFMDLDPAVKDRWGLPVARMYLASPAHHAIAGQWLLDRGLEILDTLGADLLTAETAGAVNRVLVHGTCRAGHDPSTSVLNQYCQAHEVSNLFVVDGSFMPTSGGVPTTLTILANSFRVADFIIHNRRALASGRMLRRHDRAAQPGRRSEECAR